MSYKHVFVIIEVTYKWGKKILECELLSGNQAKLVMENPEQFIEDWHTGATLLVRWPVGTNIKLPPRKEASAVLDAILPLDSLGEAMPLTKLLEMIFLAGFLQALDTDKPPQPNKDEDPDCQQIPPTGWPSGGDPHH